MRAETNPHLLLHDDGRALERGDEGVQHVAQHRLQERGIRSVHEVAQRGGGDETHTDGLCDVEEGEDGVERLHGEVFLQVGREVGGELSETAYRSVADARMRVVEGGDDVLADGLALLRVGDDVGDLREREHDGVATAPVLRLHVLVDQRVERREEDAATQRLGDAAEDVERVGEGTEVGLVGLLLAGLPGRVVVDGGEHGEEDVEQRDDQDGRRQRADHHRTVLDEDGEELQRALTRVGVHARRAGDADHGVDERFQLTMRGGGNTHVLLEEGRVDLDEVAERLDDLAGKQHVVVVQHVTKRAENERDQNHEGERLRGLELQQQRTHGATGLHLDERMVVLLQGLLEDGQQIRKVVLVRNC